MVLMMRRWLTELWAPIRIANNSIKRICRAKRILLKMALLGLSVFLDSRYVML